MLGLMLLMSNSGVYARSRTPLRFQNATGLLVQNYTDSLRNYRDSLYREEVSAPALCSNQDMAPLFLPLTFYKTVSHNALVMDGSLSPLDEQLLGVYLGRPDMVRGTQSDLEKSGPALVANTVTERPSIVVNQPLPQEPETKPVDVVVLKPNFWKFSGDYYLQFLQSYVSSNWYKGGESNYSMVGSLTLEANYNNKQKVKWDNKLEMKLGFQTSKSDSLHKLKTSSDLLRYTGKLGLQATKKWYYTFQLLAYSQFMRGYKSNQRGALSDFMSPLNVNASLGMDYTVEWLKKRLTGTIHLAPIAYNFKYVDRLALSMRYGLDEGHHSLHDFGSQFTLDLKWKFTENILWQTRLYGYTSYERAEVEWENTFTFQFNKYISTKLFVYPRFDDGTSRDVDHGYWQLNEFVSLGFSYSF
ncbi:MAG: DUF3078 domain-containing protein [Prevotella sp.]|nr:DUF3078 domain-containing protein [Prevotella sp.]